MRKCILTVAFMAILVVPVCADYDPDTDYSAAMISAACSGDTAAGEQAQMARDEKIQAEGLGYPCVSYNELYLLAKIIYAEAGSYWLSDEHQQLVGSVLLNRIASPEFPNTMEECLYQQGQYYSKSSSYFANLRPSERAANNALYLLTNGSIAPKSVVFQANFRQGSGVYKTISDRYLGNSYFCYSSNPSLYET